MAINREPENTGAGFEAAADGMGGNPQKFSHRQSELNSRWAFYQVQEHMGKGVDWEGRPVMSHSLKDAISRDGYLAPGYSTVGDSLPREFRRPVAPLGICRNITSRFTGLLFSNRKQPRMRVPGDEKTEDYLGAQLEIGEFWAAMIKTRNYGGAMGSGCVGFQFRQGQCKFEALDPRWTTPEFAGKGSNELARLTIQYAYSEEKRDPETERWKKVWFWYRRVIDTETDTTWVPVKCKKQEPNWDFIQKNTVRHGLGYVPYEWIQNLAEGDDIDGEPDCAGIFDLVLAIDSLLTEIYSGTIKNLDPTLVLSTDMDFKAVQKGSDNALKMSKGDTAAYMELMGSGPKVGLEVLKEMEDRAYRLAQCVPDQVLFTNSGEKTALEIERIFSSMMERADDLREQYGPAMGRICRKLLTAIRMWTQLKQLEDGRWVRGKVYVTPKVIQQPDGDTVEIPREIGKGTICEVKWPSYFRPTATDIETAIRIGQSAKDAEFITKATAVNFIAPFMEIDPLKELHALKRAEEAVLADEAAAGAGPEAGGDAIPPPVGAEDPAAAEEGAAPAEGGAPAAGTPVEMNPQAWKTALDSGLVTINEYREKALGLGALPDGDLTMIQYRAKNAELFVANAAISSPTIAAKAVQGDQPAAPGTPGSGGPPGQPPARPSNAPGGKLSERNEPPSDESEEDPASAKKPPEPPAASSRPAPPPQKLSDLAEKSESEADPEDKGQ